MAVTHNEVDLTWDTGSATNSLAASTGESSDVLTLNATCVGASITIKADNAGTPASGDTLDCYARYSCGDPDGDSTDEHDTIGHAVYLGTIDTNSEDPGILTVPLNPNVISLQLYTYNNGASSMTVSAVVCEVRA